MRIAVISDTHISDKTKKLPEKLIEALKKVDMVIHAGDIIELHVLDALKSLCPQIWAVCGNMDSAEVKERLPQKDIVTAGKYKIAIMHGWGPPAGLADLVLKEFEKEKPDIIIFGHSHNPVNEKRQDILLFNPGSVTDKVFAKFNSFGIIEINDAIEAEIIKL